MKKYEIFGYTCDLPSIIIEAENFDKALEKAREKQPKYCSGRVYDEKIGLINPPKKFYSVDLQPEKADELKAFLKQNNIYFEPSSCYNLIHFEIKADSNEAEAVNNFLDTLN